MRRVRQRFSALPTPRLSALPAAVFLQALRLLALSAALSATAADWPQFLGPRRDGTSPDPITTPWPADGPQVRWSREVGSGFSGPVVVGKRVLLHQRRGSEEILECLDADQGGKMLWSASQPTGYRDDFGFDNGPRATPAVQENRVFTFGAEGTLSAFDLDSGKVLWSSALGRQLGADKGFFGFASSPLPAGALVLVNVGAPNNAGIVAVEAATGQIRWKSTSHGASYSAPILTPLEGAPRAVFFTRAGLAVVDPTDGRLLAEHPWRSRQNASVNAAAPLALGTNRIFLTTSYDTGATLLEIREGKVRSLWSNDESLSSHYASVVHRDGLIFGFHGRQEYGASLRCIDAATGKVRWTKDGLGSGSLMLAGQQLLVLTERGELIAAPAVPEGFRPAAQAQVLGSGTRAFPALANGLWFGRDTRKLVCLNLRTPGQTP